MTPSLSTSTRGEALALALLRHPERTLAATLLVTLAAGWLAAGLRFDSSYYALLPDDAAPVRESNAVRDLTGGNRQLVVVIEGADPDARLAFGRELVPRLEALDEIRTADVELPVDFFADRALWLVDLETLRALVPAVDEAVRLARRRHNPLGLGLEDDADTERRLEAAWADVRRLAEGAEAGDGVLPDAVLTSRDGRATFLLVAPTVRVMDMAGGRRLFDGLERAVAELRPADRGLTVQFAGKFAVVREQHQVMTADLRTASLLALVLCTLIVVAFARRLSAPLIVAGGVLVGVVWTLAVARLALGQLNLLTGLLVPVLVGLGIDFGIHLVMRFREECDLEGHAPREAAVRAVLGVTPPSTFAALTTAGAFGALMLSDFRGFAELGAVAAAGVVLTLLSSLVVVPAALVLAARWSSGGEIVRRVNVPPSTLFSGRRRRLSVPPSTPCSGGRRRLSVPPSTPCSGRRRRLSVPPSTLFSGGGIGGRPIGRRVGLPLVLLALTALAAYGATALGDLRYENDFRLLGGEAAESADLFAWVDENVDLRFDPTVLIVDDVADARRATEVLEGRRSGLAGSRLDTVFSAADLVPAASVERASLIAELRGLLAARWLDRADASVAADVARARELTAAEPWTLDEVPLALRRRLTTLDGEQLLVFVWSRDRIESDAAAVAWAGELEGIRGDLAAAGLHPLISTETVMPAWVHHHIVGEAPRLLVAAAAIVALLVFVHLRSPRRALLVLAPLAVGVLGTVALIDLAGLELNMFNLIALPCAIGIGIDDLLHLAHRYFERGRGSAPFVLRRTGAAVLLTTLTTLFGFGSTLIAHHAGLRSLGTLAVVAIGAVFVAAVAFLPCLLVVIERFGARHASPVADNPEPEPS